MPMPKPIPAATSNSVLVTRARVFGSALKNSPTSHFQVAGSPNPNHRLAMCRPAIIGPCYPKRQRKVQPGGTNRPKRPEIACKMLQIHQMMEAQVTRGAHAVLGHPIIKVRLLSRMERNRNRVECQVDLHKL